MAVVVTLLSTSVLINGAIELVVDGCKLLSSFELIADSFPSPGLSLRFSWVVLTLIVVSFLAVRTLTTVNTSADLFTSLSDCNERGAGDED